MSRTRSFPAENGWTGHQAPIVRTKVSKVCAAPLRTSTDCRTGGRRIGVTTARPPGSLAGVMRLSWVAIRIIGHGAARCGCDSPRAGGLVVIAYAPFGFD